MTRRIPMVPVLATFLAMVFAATPAIADQVAAKPRMLRIKRPMPPPRAAYKVDFIGENGQRLQVFRRRGATYVLGSRGQRYSIRVKNPTNRRIEAVVSVDGLDAIDGRAASFRKRGYVIPAYGQVKIDGFRTSQSNVATFRFSAVRNSYAARTGRSSRVGVVQVAIFDESAPIMIRPRPHWRHRRHQHRRPSRRSYKGQGSASKPRAKVRGRTTGRHMNRPARRRPHWGAPRPQPGLGTSYGERRRSAVQYTTFTRRHTWRPSFVTTLNYNNRLGLVSMGILPGRVGLHIAK